MQSRCNGHQVLNYGLWKINTLTMYMLIAVVSINSGTVLFKIVVERIPNRMFLTKDRNNVKNQRVAEYYGCTDDQLQMYA